MNLYDKRVFLLSFISSLFREEMVMANKALFATKPSASVADTVNNAGGKAYSFDDKHALAQLAATGCLNDTFYTKAEDQLKITLELAAKVPAEFVAKVALWSREHGYMKDMPALLCAYLAAKGEGALLTKVFPRVINNGKMLRNFVQIIRSGVTGRKSFGSLPKRLISQYFESHDAEFIFRNSVGNDPSLADVIKMAHPKPDTKGKAALFAYLIGKKHTKKELPQIVRDYLDYLAGDWKDLPKLPFEMLSSSSDDKAWAELAKVASWTGTRMNLKSFAKHNVFKDKKAIKMIVDRLKDEELIAKANVFPYQLMIAHKMASADSEVPSEVTEALQDAMEIAIETTPVIDGKVFVFVDVSGSMQSAAITGNRGSATSSVMCSEVAALIASMLLRKNPNATIMPFSDHLYPECRLNPRDTVMTNAKILAELPSGGTNCSAPLAKLNADKAEGDVLIYVSDNESWVDSVHCHHGATATLAEWQKFQKRNPKAKLVCIDLAANTTTQAKNSNNVMNIGGFSDAIFSIIDAFITGGKEQWVQAIEAMD
jgi:60 kDa SS-A/Ro ribonucleoprotein